MTEILQNWLLTRLGSVVDLRPEQIGMCCQDGMLFGQLLHNYDVISSEQLTMLDCSNSVSNMKNLSLWMKPIGVECTAETINDIICGDGLASTKLLYQLYLNLEDKDRLLFTTDGNQRPANDRFTVTTVTNDRNESTRKDNLLSLPLAANRDIIAWYKNKHTEVSSQLESIRERYKKKLKQDVGDELRLTALEKRIKKSIDDEYAELQQQINKFEDKMGDAETLVFSKESSETLMSDKNRLPFNADEYMATLKERKRKMNSYRNTKLKLQNLIFDDLWKNMLAKREEAFDFTISSKMLKQSQYEKQMITKLFEIRHQRDIILDNRKILDKMIARKREEELAKELFERKRASDEKRLNFLAEKQRAKELHRRIYEEKKQKEAKETYKMCYGTVEDIVDIAIKIGHYRKCFDEDAPCELINEYKALFFTCQPIFDILKDVEDIIEEIDGDIDEYIRLEKVRQEILNEHDFFEYITNTGSWCFHDDDKSSEDNIADWEYSMAKHIYGHIVHKLLTIKYPYPEPPKPPELPAFSIFVCVLGVNDFTILPTLQMFLNKRKICIIEMQNAINYCLQAFKDEMIGIDEIDLAFALQTAKDLMCNEKKSEKKDEPETKRSLGKKIEKPPEPVEAVGKAKDKKKDDKKHAANNVLPVKAELAVKETQTPQCLPEEECMAKMSNKATLGKYAYLSLSVGRPVTDQLLVAMLIEYLKTFTDKNGFVLFNYPCTYPQAIIMEESVTAKKIPNSQLDQDSICDFEERDMQETDSKNSCKHERYSCLVPHPRSKSEQDSYTTFLTAFIEAKHREGGPLNQEKEEEGEQKEEEEELDLLGNFYTEQGVNYSLIYNTFDLQTIKHLAKLIIGDYSLPRKTSEELFGNLEDLEHGLHKNGKKPAAKKVEKKDASKEKIKDIHHHSGEKFDDKKAKAHETEAEEGSRETDEGLANDTLAISDGETNVHEMEPKPGDEKYEYVNLPQSDIILKGLASLWETAEYVFINDLKEIFFIRRILISTIMPYVTSVKQHMKQFIERPDIKQNFVYDFQKMYNEIDEDVRDDVEMKAELLCRLEELKENLWSICDQRMGEAEEERQRIIRERWMTDQMCILINLFISCMQVTVDFWTDALQIINDYYETMMGNQLDEEITSEKIILERMTIVKNSETDLKEKQHSFIDNGEDAGLMIAEVFKDVKLEMLPEDNPFHIFIENCFNSAVTICGATFDASIENIQNQIEALNSPKKGGKPAGGKDAKKGAKKLPPPPNIEEIKQHSPKILNEWLCALKSGKYKLSLRLKLIRKKAEIDITMFQNCAVETFHGIYKQISERYDNEINSITSLCTAVSKAIEEEIKIQPQLLLEGDKFIVEKNILLYPDLLPEPEGPVQERITPSEFTIEQLNMLYKILTDIAPTGSIPERTFSFILQDLIVHNAEDGFKGILPGVWAVVNSNEVTDLIKHIYGDSEYLDWRDFIIYNFDVEFPNEHIILETFFQFLSLDKNKNELINEESFKSFKLWFEDDKNNDPQLELRLQLLKELLFKMFLVESGVANYTAMLLAFCKDKNPIVGLAKAFSIAAKSLICWNNEEGEKYVETEYLKREMTEKLRLEAEATANVVIGDVIDTTLQHTEGVVITEVVSQENVTEKEQSTKSTYSEEYEGECSDIDLMFHENAEEFHSYTQLVDCVEPLSISDTEDKEYFLSFGTVLNVLAACLPWHIRNEIIENKTLRQQLENVFIDLATNLNDDGKILSHQFFNHPFVTRLLSNIHKFQVVRPADVIIEIMKNRK